LSVIFGLETAKYASCEFAVVEYRRFAVEILMRFVIVSEMLVLPVIWLPSWIAYIDVL